ncbi:DUF159 domain protein [Drepanopeziza brunnea f. sp. 'multigermtubi' MB_m1]|uniref:DUF159 domain protein n=1 Tax=Marssonina brunnea f. sp. multigermtubi (strain MB_m1) TaxID=1072389 RepID=K1WHL5_MARBU|nr:DUF159 domain protein [Drepanopeziza brunnea f. sp. 'multigermtubi' MB_m1]EKD17075.1 DUF159 domain protein [Drepanopeziza brunnea f. sp. 'multigermtubi' MB_m1]
MCGRYALALRPQQVRAYLEEGGGGYMPVDEAPGDEGDGDGDGDGASRQSYNFAPGYYGLVYRADVPDCGAGGREGGEEDADAAPAPAPAPAPAAGQQGEKKRGVDVDVDERTGGEVRYRLQSMRWGLVPFWTKRDPGYGGTMKTINCRDDSLVENRGMWTTMKQKKRCVVVFQGFYEWLKKGKEKVPHYVKRKDGQLTCVAGLWDCVQYEGSARKHYTYTIITTDSNPQLKFLHDRMPVILDNGSEDLRTWLDPKRHTWSKELQGLLKPYEGELEVYPVSKEVGKVGNNSPNFIVPVASSENKSNIANFFAKGAAKKKEASKPSTAESTEETTKQKAAEEDFKDEEVKETDSSMHIKHEEGEDRKTIDHEGSEHNAPLPVPEIESKKGIKRELDDVPDEELPRKIPKTSTASPGKAAKTGRSRSSTSNNTASPSKPGKGGGSRKITSFFGK